MKIKKRVEEIHSKMLNAGMGIISDFMAQECTMICIDEVIDAIPQDRKIRLEYWKSVKKEAKKLFNHKS